MSGEYDRDLAIETTTTALDRAHRGVLAMDAAEVRRGLQLALAALSDVHGAESGGGDSAPQPIAASIQKLTNALADLDQGALAEMETLIEEVRTSLG